MAKAQRKRPAEANTRRGRPVRLDLTEEEHVRLERCARERGLNKASYARMVVLDRLKVDEGGRG